MTTNGNISISNTCKVNIMATVVRYDHETYSDIKPFPINSGSSKAGQDTQTDIIFAFYLKLKYFMGSFARGENPMNIKDKDKCT